jgi:hypothetical protein
MLTSFDTNLLSVIMVRIESGKAGAGVSFAERPQLLAQEEVKNELVRKRHKKGLRG